MSVIEFKVDDVYFYVIGFGGEQVSRMIRVNEKNSRIEIRSKPDGAVIVFRRTLEEPKATKWVGMVIEPGSQYVISVNKKDKREVRMFLTDKPEPRVIEILIDGQPYIMSGKQGSQSADFWSSLFGNMQEANAGHSRQPGSPGDGVLNAVMRQFNQEEHAPLGDFVVRL